MAELGYTTLTMYPEGTTYDILTNSLNLGAGETTTTRTAVTPYATYGTPGDFSMNTNTKMIYVVLVVLIIVMLYMAIRK